MLWFPGTRRLWEVKHKKKQPVRKTVKKNKHLATPACNVKEHKTAFVLYGHVSSIFTIKTIQECRKIWLLSIPCQWLTWLQHINIYGNTFVCLFQMSSVLVLLLLHAHQCCLCPSYFFKETGMQQDVRQLLVTSYRRGLKWHWYKIYPLVQNQPESCGLFSCPRPLRAHWSKRRVNMRPMRRRYKW